MIAINIKREYYQKLVLQGLNNYINFLIKAIKDMLILKIYSMFQEMHVVLNKLKVYSKVVILIKMEN